MLIIGGGECQCSCNPLQEHGPALAQKLCGPSVVERERKKNERGCLKHLLLEVLLDYRQICSVNGG